MPRGGRSPRGLPWTLHRLTGRRRQRARCFRPPQRHTRRRAERSGRRGSRRRLPRQPLRGRKRRQYLCASGRPQARPCRRAGRARERPEAEAPRTRTRRSGRRGVAGAAGARPHAGNHQPKRDGDAVRDARARRGAGVDFRRARARRRPCDARARAREPRATRIWSQGASRALETRARRTAPPRTDATRGARSRLASCSYTARDIFVRERRG